MGLSNRAWFQIYPERELKPADLSLIKALLIYAAVSKPTAIVLEGPASLGRADNDSFRNSLPPCPPSTWGRRLS